ncbi:hypothetical protein BH23CYA1_BH23CYA1_10250 [soil metagenome]
MLQEVFFAFIWIALLILAGRLVKQQVRWIQRLYLPESIVAGAIALILGPQILGAIATSIGGEGTLLSGGLFTEAIRDVWSQSPGIFINIVFAALFLGEIIPSPGAIWRKAAPQVVFGQSLAWGQYVVGILVTLIILIPLFDANPISAALIEIGFEGGHGTAGGMAGTLGDLGFEEGALLLAMVDPENKSGAFESFAYKQLFFEPIVGGGLFTAAAPALIAQLGLWVTLLITAGLLVFWLGVGFLLMRQESRRMGAVAE